MIYISLLCTEFHSRL